MRGFFIKLKRSNKVLLAIYLIVLIAYIISLAFFTRSLLLLNDIETTIRIISLVIFYLILFAYFLFGLVLLFLKKNAGLVVFSSFLIILITTFNFGSYYINNIYNELDQFNQERITLTSNLIALEDVQIDNTSVLGMIEDQDDIEGHVLANQLILAEKLGDNEIIFYEDYFEMIADLADEKIDGAFVPNNYRAMFGSIEDLDEIIENSVVIFSYSEEFDNDSLANDRSLTEPFTVLIVGVDANIPNGNVLMLLTYNPQTLSATMLSIPRDIYVPITCFNNNFQKINSSAGRMSCATDTIENLTGIPIDFYVKIDFFGFVDLVEALGGITVDVSTPDFQYNRRRDCRGMICEQDSRRRWGAYTVWIEPGEQRLNGEQALAYVRNRAQFRDSDFARNRHQQQVLMAIASEARSIRSLNDFMDILNVVQTNIDTNLSTNQILSLYNVGRDVLRNMRNESLDFAVQRMHLEVYDLRVFLPRARSHTMALGHFQDSLDAIVHAKKVNLGLEEPEIIKTIEFSVNEPFTVRDVGRGLRSGERLELMPNLVGRSKDYVESWARARGINVTTRTVSAGSSLYNPNLSNGTVVSQSIHQNELVRIQTSLTIDVISSSE